MVLFSTGLCDSLKGFFKYMLMLKNVINRCQRYRYEIITCVIMATMGWVNIIGVKMSPPLPLVPPGYYENIMQENSDRIISFRNDYIKSKNEITEWLMSGPHSNTDVSIKMITLNTTELRYISYWIFLKSYLLGMWKPFENIEGNSWYFSLSPELRNQFRNNTLNIHSNLSILVKCEANLIKERNVITTSLQSASNKDVIEGHILTIKKIVDNLSNPEKSAATVCDTAMINYADSLQRLSSIYIQLADAYDKHASRNDTLWKVFNAILMMCLFYFSVKCRGEIVKSLTKPFGV